MSDTSEIIIKPEDEDSGETVIINVLEILAIQAMMNPASEEVACDAPEE